MHHSYEESNIPEDSEHIVRSAAECQEMCELNTACYFFTFHIVKGTCSLKDEKALEARESSYGYISGPKSCTCNLNLKQPQPNIFLWGMCNFCSFPL